MIALAACVALGLSVLGHGHSTGASGPQTTTVLYDGALGTMPEAQGFVFLDLPPGSAARSWADGATLLNTLALTGTYAGYTAQSSIVPVLDRQIGYSVTFTTQLLAESHAGSDRNGDGVDDRAGFSVTVLSTDTLGIEFGFWTDRVWAQEGGSGSNLFTQAEGMPFDTTSRLITYTLAVSGTAYTLWADGAPLLNGTLRDYTAFTGPLDPYETPNLIFLGDNSASARASVRLAAVSVTTGAAPPVLSRRIYLPVIQR
jgi:hypothetical protein